MITPPNLMVFQTRIKLQKLTEERGLDPSLHQKILAGQTKLY
jgi:hypothetical protein